MLSQRPLSAALTGPLDSAADRSRHSSRSGAVGRPRARSLMTTRRRTTAIINTHPAPEPAATGRWRDHSGCDHRSQMVDIRPRRALVSSLVGERPASDGGVSTLPSGADHHVGPGIVDPPHPPAPRHRAGESGLRHRFVATGG